MSRATITRRGLVQAAGAALGAVGLPALADAAIPASDPDAVLFDLIARHGEATADLRRVEIASDTAFAAFLFAVPPKPDVLRWREGDFPRTTLGLGLSGRAESDDVRWYGERAVGWLREHPAAGWFPDLAPPIGPECETRRLEILTAWDEHMAARRALEIGTGYAAACEAVDAAADLVVTLAAEVARAKPQTLPGLRALAAWFGQQAEADEAFDNFLALFAGTVAAFGEVVV
ncbi:MAG: hypothetical protein ACRYGP_30185 [Janthinobacterium lividum]